MSRAFVKETDQEQLPFVPPRAHLPAGVPNYVTSQGLLALQHEMESLQTRKQTALQQPAKDDEQRIVLYELNEKIRMLQERLATAQTVEHRSFSDKEVHFGARILLRNEHSKHEQSLTIVGVDEANLAQGKMSFVSPLAKALAGKKCAEKVEVPLPAGIQTFTILSIAYDS